MILRGLKNSPHLFRTLKYGHLIIYICSIQVLICGINKISLVNSGSLISQSTVSVSYCRDHRCRYKAFLILTGALHAILTESPMT